ncbi:T9SS type A sorting domain-containing protein [Flammeovirga sp. EKP202]|uniref:T9SS type A sorting domain-containing protein n=1 Tax=Flammeovirga sp. EKP202 TaxID=2770592 RepID=UPI00165EF7DD|nr:T9SS type A sorting domain-containing protein [Flammeovirga sp. EKP202]MBD0401321.1 T9SS type A sorting domain-containing protein [Flammeovirga sp. EKP202]
MDVWLYLSIGLRAPYRVFDAPDGYAEGVDTYPNPEASIRDKDLFPTTMLVDYVRVWQRNEAWVQHSDSNFKKGKNKVSVKYSSVGTKNLQLQIINKDGEVVHQTIKTIEGQGFVEFDVDMSEYTEGNYSFVTTLLKGQMEEISTHQKTIPVLDKIEETPTSLDVENQLIQIYPNPATTLLNIKSHVVDDYQIISLTGKVVQEGEVKIGENQIELNGLKGSLYFVHLMENNFTSKLLIQGN